MIVQHILIQELILYEFGLDHNTTEAIKNIYCAKSGGVFNYSAVTRWFKKLRSDCKELEEQEMTGRPKTVDSVSVLQAIEVNPENSTRRVSSEIGYYISLWFVTFIT